MTWVGLALASILGGVVKGAMGFGGALMMAPLFVVLVGPRESTILIVLIHAFTCLQGLRGWHGSVRWPSVISLALIAVSCAAIFTWLLEMVDTVSVRRVTGCSVVLLAIIQFGGWRWRHKGGPIPAALAGILSGVCTAAAGTGGPPVVIYFAGDASTGQNGKEAVRSNLLAYFLLLYTLSAVGLALQGRVGLGLGLKSVVLAPLFFLGGIGGERLFTKVNHHQFGRLVAGVLILSGLAMVFL